MNERELLLRAVYANLEDDIARMVYADYLMGTGNDRDFAIGEFIMAHIQKPDNCYKYWLRVNRAYDELYGMSCVLHCVSVLSNQRRNNIIRIHRGFPYNMFIAIAHAGLSYQPWKDIPTLEMIEYRQRVYAPFRIHGFKMQNETTFIRSK